LITEAFYSINEFFLPGGDDYWTLKFLFLNIANLVMDKMSFILV
jgi:hypothetical protein